MGSKIRKSTKSEKGQSLILLAASAVGIMALLALTLDGGFALMRRRAAQNAADGGALAGARKLCVTGDPDQAEATAIEYAVTYNTAQSAVAESLDGVVTVDATAQYNSFFAGIFGISQIDVSARAKAGCFAPGFGESVLPVAWSCNPPTDPDDETETEAYTFADCEVKSISPQELIERQLDWNFHQTWFPELYVIMDQPSSADDIECAPDGPINCDLDGDGTDDLLAEGDRSWLNLDGGNGSASELDTWIEDGYDGDPIPIHFWSAGQQGVSNNVFLAVRDFRVGELVLVPVFNGICVGDPWLTWGCLDAIHLDGSPGSYDAWMNAEGSEDTIAYSDGTYNTYFHVIGFAAFYISCVHTGGSDSLACPGYNLIAEASWIDIGVNDKTIEGYFITAGFMYGISGTPSDGVDTGIYTVYLTE